MESIKLTQEEIGKLVEKLLDLGLRTKFEVATDLTLQIALGKEKLKLSPALQTLAFDLASKEISERFAVLFAEELLQQIRKVAEEDTGKKSKKRDKGGSGGADGNSTKATSPAENAPQNAQEVYNDLKEFLGKNKSPYAFKDEVLEDMAERVAEKGEEIRKKLGLSEKQLLGLAAVSLFDIIFVCDDSGSMSIGERIPALVKTLQSVADWATRLEPTGISLRFLNYEEDGDERFDNLTDLEKIKDVCHLAQPRGDTELGGVLQRKVLNRRILENKSKRLSKPLIVAIITDGEPDDDDEESIFRNVVIQCKEELEAGSVVFILFRVGDSEEAEEFLDEVSNDKETSDIVYCSANDSLDDMLERLSKARTKEGTQDLNPYKRFILEQFIRSISEGWADEFP